MSNESDPKARVLLRAVDEILHYVWDPIGVAAVPQARDEYQSYVPQVFQLLQTGASEGEISGYLSMIATDRMGLDNSPERHKDAASALVDWKEFLDGLA